MCLGLVYAQSLHEPAILLGCQLPGLGFRAWPLEGTGLQTLVKQKKAVALPIQGLNSVPASAAEQEQGVCEGIQFKLLLHNTGQV